MLVSSGKLIIEVFSQIFLYNNVASTFQYRHFGDNFQTFLNLLGKFKPQITIYCTYPMHKIFKLRLVPGKEAKKGIAGKRMLQTIVVHFFRYFPI